jgi:uncharacterized LabA/DUF88 family protein
MQPIKTAIFIDGANVYKTAKALGFDVDYKLLPKAFGDSVTRCLYYTALLPEKQDGMSDDLRPLLDWLEYNSYTVVTKMSKSFFDEATARIKVKGNMDIELTVDAMELSNHIDNIVIMSGDGDFTSLVKALQRKGCHVTVVSTIKSNPPMCADELRRAADTFIDLDSLSSVKKKKRDSTPVVGKLSKFASE